MLSVISQFTPPYKLHMGCGTVKLEGWINVDADMESSAADLQWDASQVLPFADQSCQFIYHEHFLEHLPIADGVSFLRECYRILEIGGVMRIAMPSLDALLEKCETGNWKDQDWLTWDDYKFIQTKAEMLNIAFRWWGHQWLYDWEELHRRLTDAGFQRIHKMDWQVSQFHELERLETRKDSILICEVIK
jgi:predicted SAM-dependent methyltransferase